MSLEMMKGALGDGYATTTVDAGLTDGIERAKDLVLPSRGNVNYLLPWDTVGTLPIPL